jgi:CRISPR-associated endonuclease/helicase Cas3
VGKANSGFQEAVRGRPDAQVIRHEHLSGLLLWLPQVRKWLDGCNVDSVLVTSAVIGHHLRAEPKDFAEPLNADRRTFTVYSAGLSDAAALMAGALAIGAPPALAAQERWSFGNGRECQDVDALSRDLKKALTQLKRDLAGDETRHRLLMAVRAALLIADSAGSALAREHKDLGEWLNAAFNEDDLVHGDAIEHKVLAPRVEDIRKHTGEFRYTDFQLAADGLPERALLLASCGSGKTLAAWRWIKARAAIRPVARAIFLYPTRATATEGFRDYVSWAPEADAALMHGTSAYELAGLFTNTSDPRHGRDYTAEDRLFALAYWPRRIFSATVDQFLGFLQHSYRSACLLPLLVDSVIVVDEVHSFDRSLFSALKRFLKSFNLPVLCMTASLPPQRQKDLEDCGLKRFPTEDDAERLADLQAMAEMPRYRTTCVADEEVACRAATEARSRGKRVLWVVNTVARCQRVAKTLGAVCYHSRFTLEDRNRRHKEVISAFRRGGGPVLTVTTQVCEMSLDLDAEILLSETAPITALIQRMGRCNRHAGPGRTVPALGEVHVYPAQNQAPYGKDDMEGVAEFLKAVDGQTLSQSRLQELLEKYGPREIEVERYAAFLEGGPWACSREASLREGVDFTVPAILDRDVEVYLARRRARQPSDGLFVPVPRRLARTDPRLGSWPLVGPASHYDLQFGWLDAPLENRL